MISHLSFIPEIGYKREEDLDERGCHCRRRSIGLRSGL
jgi:hypothetical protein